MRVVGGVLLVLLAASAAPPDEASAPSPAALRTAAERGDAEAQYQLALAFLARGGRASEREATRWLRAAASQRHAGAEARLARLYTEGLAVRADPRAAAEKGQPEAAFRLAGLHRSGTRVAKDEAEVLRWLRLAAEKGHGEAQLALGACISPPGRTAPRPSAARWFRAAARRGDAPAQFAIGTLYADGRGVEKDAREALRWYRAAAEQGHTEAQNNLGSMYEHGLGVGRDPQAAARWYRRAAEGGDAMGQFNLALLFEGGQGVRANEREAARWLQAAAEQGFADALARLGGYQAAGRGGLSRSATSAAESYYRAGLAYVQQDRKDGARRCLEALRALEKEGGLTPPHTELDERLAAALAGR